MKLEKFLCLKNLGRRSPENSAGFLTIKLLLFSLQETIESEDESSTISYVLVRKGGSELEPPLFSSIPYNHFKSKRLKPNSNKTTTPNSLDSILLSVG